MGDFFCLNCKNKSKRKYGSKKYCSISCRTEHWNKLDYNPFKGKKHSIESISKYKTHPNYINRRFAKGWKHSLETKHKLRKPRGSDPKDWNRAYRHDVKYEGPERITIIDRARRWGAKPDDLAKIWFDPCCLCGWDLGKCDIHHKIPQHKGGSSKSDNLLVLCPNCHRLVHKGIIDVELI